ncbi:MAG: hydantoinase/oxoprolinase family protein [Methylococcales bacterium]
MIPESIIGWDIGGAHVKIAVLHGEQVVEVSQHPCPLWRGISGFEEVVDRILHRHGRQRVCHAVTMTGELADCFSGRDQGVQQILAVLAARIDPACLTVFAGTEGLLAYEGVNSTHYPNIASANWLASAIYVARILDTAFFLDIGSTTTDIVLLQAGKVRAKGFEDFDRLISGELVYTGIVRTPIAALAKQVYFEGQRVPLMAELFATTADVYRLTGELPEDYDQWPAADGAEKSIAGSAKRLARMIGRDGQSAPLNSWIRLAAFLREQQLEEIQEALLRQLSRLDCDRNPLIVGAGIGRFLAADLSRRCAFEYRDFTTIGNYDPVIPGIAECAPAVALARLLVEQLLR